MVSQGNKGKISPRTMEHWYWGWGRCKADMQWTDEEKLWEHGNSGQFLQGTMKGTRTSLGDPHHWHLGPRRARITALAIVSMLWVLPLCILWCLKLDRFSLIQVSNIVKPERWPLFHLKCLVIFILFYFLKSLPYRECTIARKEHAANKGEPLQIQK